MIEKDSKIPVPEPITLAKSESNEIKPMIISSHIPATGIELFSTLVFDFIDIHSPPYIYP